jgi:hypothetical protein
MQRAVVLRVLLTLAAVASSVAAVPTGTTLLAFEVPVVPLPSTSASFDCPSDRTISVVSSPTSSKVKVIDATDPMRWSARIDGSSILVTTRSGASGRMRIASRDHDTLRAIADEGVAESLALDYRSGRAVFTTSRNFPANIDNELLARVHYMRCVASPAK